MASLILTALFAVTVLISAIYGLIRGLNKSVIRLITIVVAAALTFLVAGPITTAIVENITIEGQTLGEMILGGVNQMDMVGPMLETMP